MDIKNRKELIQEVEQTLGLTPQWLRELPDSVAPSFWTMLKDFYLAETQIPNKYKDLIGIAVAGATRCKYCALFHTELAKLNGATDAEIAEANMVSGLTMCASTFVNGQQIDYDAFKQETLKIVAYVKKHAPAKGRPSVNPSVHA